MTVASVSSHSSVPYCPQHGSKLVTDCSVCSAWAHIEHGRKKLALQEERLDLDRQLFKTEKKRFKRLQQQQLQHNHRTPDSTSSTPLSMDIRDKLRELEEEAKEWQERLQKEQREHVQSNKLARVELAKRDAQLQSARVTLRLLQEERKEQPQHHVRAGETSMEVAERHHSSDDSVTTDHHVRQLQEQQEQYAQLERRLEDVMQLSAMSVQSTRASWEVKMEELQEQHAREKEEWREAAEKEWEANIEELKDEHEQQLWTLQRQLDDTKQFMAMSLMGKQADFDMEMEAKLEQVASEHQEQQWTLQRQVDDIKQFFAMSIMGKQADFDLIMEKVEEQHQADKDQWEAALAEQREHFQQQIEDLQHSTTSTLPTEARDEDLEEEPTMLQRLLKEQSQRLELEKIMDLKDQDTAIMADRYFNQINELEQDIKAIQLDHKEEMEKLEKQLSDLEQEKNDSAVMVAQLQATIVDLQQSNDQQVKDLQKQIEVLQEQSQRNTAALSAPALGAMDGIDDEDGSVYTDRDQSHNDSSNRMEELSKQEWEKEKNESAVMVAQLQATIVDLQQSNDQQVKDLQKQIEVLQEQSQRNTAALSAPALGFMDGSDDEDGSIYTDRDQSHNDSSIRMEELSTQEWEKEKNDSAVLVAQLQATIVDLRQSNDLQVQDLQKQIEVLQEQSHRNNVALSSSALGPMDGSDDEDDSVYTDRDQSHNDNSNRIEELMKQVAELEFKIHTMERDHELALDEAAIEKREVMLSADQTAMEASHIQDTLLNRIADLEAKIKVLESEPKSEADDVTRETREASLPPEQPTPEVEHLHETLTSRISDLEAKIDTLERDHELVMEDVNIEKRQAMLSAEQAAMEVEHLQEKVTELQDRLEFLKNDNEELAAKSISEKTNGDNKDDQVRKLNNHILALEAKVSTLERAHNVALAAVAREREEGMLSAEQQAATEAANLQDKIDDLQEQLERLTKEHEELQLSKSTSDNNRESPEELESFKQQLEAMERVQGEFSAHHEMKVKDIEDRLERTATASSQLFAEIPAIQDQVERVVQQLDELTTASILDVPAYGDINDDNQGKSDKRPGPLDDLDAEGNHRVTEVIWDGGDSQTGGKYTGWVDPQGQPHGHGILRVNNGDVYEGDWQHGQQHGPHGVYTWFDGDLYTGPWQDGKRHGHGVFVFADGRIYDGMYVEGKKQGLGVFSWPYGAKYEGDYDNDMRNGSGVYVYADGRTYKGEYKDDRPHGYGVELSKTGTVMYDGMWQFGEFVGDHDSVSVISSVM